MGKKSLEAEVWERLAEIEGAVLAARAVLLHHIALCNTETRWHAASLLDDLNKLITDLPQGIPNEHLHQALRIYREKIGYMASLDDK